MNESPDPKEEENDGLTTMEVLRGGQCQTLYHNTEACATYRCDAGQREYSSPFVWGLKACTAEVFKGSWLSMGKNLSAHQS